MIEQEWTHCGKHIGEFKLERLPRGDENSHLDFKAVNLYTQRKAGKQPSKEQLEQEYKAKEAKLLTAD